MLLERVTRCIRPLNTRIEKISAFLLSRFVADAQSEGFSVLAPDLTNTSQSNHPFPSIITVGEKPKKEDQARTIWFSLTSIFATIPTSF